MMGCSHEMLHIVPVYGSGYRLNTKDDGMWHFTLCFNAQLGPAMAFLSCGGAAPKNPLPAIISPYSCLLTQCRTPVSMP